MKMRLKEMKISSRLKGGIYEVSFGYHSKLDGNATLMSDIPKLAEIVPNQKKKTYTQHRHKLRFFIGKVIEQI